MALTIEEFRARFDNIMDAYRHGIPGGSLLSSAATKGKLYEAWVLAELLSHLTKDEGFDVTLKQGSTVVLKSSPGPINRSYPYFELSRAGVTELEIWTDVEFVGMSHAACTPGSPPSSDQYHELDIIAVPVGTKGRPTHREVILGVECKSTANFEKHMLRAALGVRRELSLLRQVGAATPFVRWPRSVVPAKPPSCVMVYSTDPAIARVDSPGRLFGIDFVHLPLP